ncbi:ABC transporter permease subunit [Paramaledivibacter caminithermalis]|jgi:simple sugar transport system permease protein|uniref:Monosaccharide ABC transporter membrane protein, CUT2 family n=1 Tax=Paramaledivibacter caminithermalis (strain DSM 15212 / CIP 107654 / DViRD3) TaxID=1121301 RepID=A0A1M6PYF4_PARC5|nr:ABC transporter [Paramaledivibacter caminithermalis]SHK12994.1 monosaccharide ABC transporter membrane protein, CUT2 family [Paramaledivibacter caminithermalis DSM 15212]
MNEAIKRISDRVGLPRLIISLLFFSICVMALILKLPASSLISDVIRRFGMFGILALAMIPSIQCGTGPNFALPLGIVCGLFAMTITIQFGLTSLIWGNGFWASVIIAIPFAALAGWIYGMMLNKIKGSEMLVATYTGFSIVSFMCIIWVVIPFKNPEMAWPIGKGLRVTFALDKSFAYFLNNFLMIKIGEIIIPTGLLLFFFGTCLAVWVFLRSKIGVALRAAGDNPKFAQASGIDVDKCRIIGTVLSNVLGAIGIIVYAQSFGFVQLYLAPLYMAFPAVAAVLIGGASAKKAKISHAILGVFLFQGLLTVALPVANQIFSEGNLSEVLRMIVQNGIILYAITKVGGAD